MQIFSIRGRGNIFENIAMGRSVTIEEVRDAANNKKC